MKGGNTFSTALVLCLVGGCASAPEPAQTKSALGDAEIAAIVVAANAVDADIGELASQRATAPEIRQFGKTMATDHRAINQAAGELVARLKVTPLENAVSQKLRTDGQAFRELLSAKTGNAFDRAYIEHEVDYHQAVIAALDELLIPNAENAELKQTIISVRPALLAHLAHAEKLRAGLK